MTDQALTVITAPLPDALTPSEQRQLEKLEGVIQQTMRAFFRDIGAALAEIQRSQLYREEYLTFEEYLEARWDLEPAYAHRLVKAAAAAQAIAQLGDGLPQPTAERQVRELADLPPEDQVAVWREACERAGGQVPSGKLVAELAEVRRAQLAPSDTPKRGRPRKASAAAIDAEVVDDQDEDDEHDPKGDEYFTPDAIVEAARTLLGGIDLDPASCEEANEVVQAKEFFDKETNGLHQVWEGRTLFMNPPYSKGLVERFVGRMCLSWTEERFERGILVVNACTSSEWFTELFDFPICWVKGRVKFRKPRAVLEAEAAAEPARRAAAKAAGKPYSPPSEYGRSATAIVFFGPESEWGDFKAVFGQFGSVTAPLASAWDILDQDDDE